MAKIGIFCECGSFLHFTARCVDGTYVYTCPTRGVPMFQDEKNPDRQTGMSLDHGDRLYAKIQGKLERVNLSRVGEVDWIWSLVRS